MIACVIEHVYCVLCTLLYNTHKTQQYSKRCIGSPLVIHIHTCVRVSVCCVYALRYTRYTIHVYCSEHEYWISTKANRTDEERNINSHILNIQCDGKFYYGLVILHSSLSLSPLSSRPSPRGLLPPSLTPTTPLATLCKQQIEETQSQSHRDLHGYRIWYIHHFENFIFALHSTPQNDRNTCTSRERTRKIQSFATLFLNSIPQHNNTFASSRLHPLSLRCASLIRNQWRCDSILVAKILDFRCVAVPSVDRIGQFTSTTLCVERLNIASD